MIPEESITVTSGGATFTLRGGTYTFDLGGTVSSGGSVQFQRQIGSAYANIGTSVGSGGTPATQNITVAAGGFKLNATSATVSATVTRVPPP